MKCRCKRERRAEIIEVVSIGSVIAGLSCVIIGLSILIGLMIRG